ncbi:hypothetical protein J6590_019737 [Homalodisca vitripennis]|nr:hypothetical protein J6590_019737 [Homalodisca vitripennis]
MVARRAQAARRSAEVQNQTRSEWTGPKARARAAVAVRSIAPRSHITYTPQCLHAAARRSPSCDLAPLFRHATYRRNRLFTRQRRLRCAVKTLNLLSLSQLSACGSKPGEYSSDIYGSYGITRGGGSLEMSRMASCSDPDNNRLAGTSFSNWLSATYREYLAPSITSGLQDREKAEIARYRSVFRRPSPPRHAVTLLKLYLRQRIKYYSLSIVVFNGDDRFFK